jgi:hypothetical protein
MAVIIVLVHQSLDQLALPVTPFINLRFQKLLPCAVRPVKTLSLREPSLDQGINIWLADYIFWKKEEKSDIKYYVDVIRPT